MKRRRFLLVGLILAGLGVLVYGGVRSAAVYYVTVSELQARGEAAYGVPVRVAGNVVPGSIRREGSRVFFVLAEGDARLPVTYRGVVTDLFRDGAPVVVEGTWGPEGVFRARVLLTKCPTKYEGGEDAP
ncbi:MAG: cytochrome c maturation protein CcmE [Armatimonadota bacterium]|nr:cytochrome c maturation protein CcmE [Armatimonadota bacterium]MDR7445125.1 cytochrome c maturation protein CcmE [Armatimonadota bacterium]MDR7569772.1 cytochrome c maturation protein CcmE [Armatimonadota bacterium]MDR7614025.1 cytochrome c maturation protein CcmE [Armatimonadota bacterium]